MNRNTERNKEQREPRSLLLSYLAGTVLIIVFALVYNHFGHGVHSACMDFAWIWPAAGTLIALVLFLTGKRAGEWSLSLLACGISTLTVGFLLQGIFEIAGTNSRFISVFFAAGAALLIGFVLSSFKALRGSSAGI